MRKTIWKYVLELVTSQVVSVPKGAKALSAQMQGNDLCIWALVVPGSERVGMPVFVHGTGHAVERDASNGRYISTVQMRGGSLIFHVFVGKGF